MQTGNLIICKCCLGKGHFIVFESIDRVEFYQESMPDPDYRTLHNIVVIHVGGDLIRFTGDSANDVLDAYLGYSGTLTGLDMSPPSEFPKLKQ